jgi:hypothetical protein
MNTGWGIAAFGQVDQLIRLIRALRNAGVTGEEFLGSLWKKGAMVKGKQTVAKKRIQRWVRFISALVLVWMKNGLTSNSNHGAG